MAFVIVPVSTFPYPSSSSIGSRPKLKPFHFDTNIVDGQMVRIFCQLSDGAQTQSFQWLKDGHPLLSSSAHIDIQTFRDYTSLVIDRVDRARDSGNYTCLVSNSYGSDQHSSLLVVQGQCGVTNFQLPIEHCKIPSLIVSCF